MAHLIHFSAKTWHNRALAQQRTAKRPIRATLIEERPKAFLITTGLRTAWVPKRLTSHDPETGTFTMPAWLAAEKLLD